MSNLHNDLRIIAGMSILTADGEDLGTVSSIEGNYIVATKGLIFTDSTYIPTSIIKSGDDTTLHLAVTADEVKASDWDEVPADFREDATVPGAGDGDALHEAAANIPSGRASTAAIRDDDAHRLDKVRP